MPTRDPIRFCPTCGSPTIRLKGKDGKLVLVNADSVEDPLATIFDPAAGHRRHPEHQ